MSGISGVILGCHRLNSPDDPLSLSVVEQAIQMGVPLHTAATYGNSLELIRRAGSGGRKATCIVKIRGQTVADLKHDVDFVLATLGADRVAAIQICANPPGLLFLNDHPYRKELERLRATVVDAIYLEAFWQYSDNLENIVGDELIDGCIFYYNVREREVTNSLMNRIHGAQKKIIALRPFGSGSLLAPVAGLQNLPYGQWLTAAGATSQAEFCLRFLFSEPSLVGVVTSTMNVAHLRQLVEMASGLSPLQPELLDTIRQAQNVWWQDHGGGHSPNMSVRPGRT